MRHIPEDELHAYLDQALSRSQCVEIERHLARCSRCQRQRDDIAALRDQTTSLLARIGPPPIVPPAYETLRARLAERHRRRWSAIRVGAVAAGLAGAVAFGWLARGVAAGGTTVAAAPGTTRTVAQPPGDSAVITTLPIPAAAAVRLAGPAAPTAPRTDAPKREPQPVRAPARPEPSERQLVRASRPPSDAPEASGFASVTEVDLVGFRTPDNAEPLLLASTFLEVQALSAQPMDADPGLEGLWRTVVPDRDGSGRSGDLPLVPGLPVIQIRVQPGNGGSEVTAVDQQLESGELIRTIAGPATRVATLVDEDARADSLVAVVPESSADRLTVTIRQGDRMVAVTGPSHALGSLLTRVNARRRY